MFQNNVAVSTEKKNRSYFFLKNEFDFYHFKTPGERYNFNIIICYAKLFDCYCSSGFSVIL